MPSAGANGSYRTRFVTLHVIWALDAVIAFARATFAHAPCNTRPDGEKSYATISFGHGFGGGSSALIPFFDHGVVSSRSKVEAGVEAGA